MTREQFWSLLLAGKVSGEELHEAFESMSEEDQQKVCERIDEMVEGIKQGLGKLTEDLHKWWASVPEEVKKGLVEYGESNISKLDE